MRIPSESLGTLTQPPAPTLRSCPARLDQASAQALAFVARRLAEPVALVFAVREPSEEEQWRGLPPLTGGGLSSSDARALLDSVTPGTTG